MGEPSEPLPPTLVAIAHFEELERALNHDITICERLLSLEDTAFARRQLVRAVFASIEAAAYRLKQVVLSFHQVEGEPLTPAEEALLKEEAYELRGDGQTRVRPAHIDTVKNVRFALTMFGRAVAPTFRADFGEAGWEALQKALGVRHRLTHPKMLGDIEVSDGDLATVRQAIAWFRSALEAAMRHASVEAFERFRAIMKKHGV